MKNWIASVKVQSGGNPIVIKTQVSAEDSYRAKLLLEQQYGRNCIISMPTLVR